MYYTLHTLAMVATKLFLGCATSTVLAGAATYAAYIVYRGHVLHTACLATVATKLFVQSLDEQRKPVATCGMVCRVALCRCEVLCEGGSRAL